MLFKDSRVYLQAGGGIVYDSVAQDEYEETLNKLKVDTIFYDESKILV